LDQSRPSQPSPSAISPSNNDANVVAIKLLQLHRELNLMRYHGIQNYMRQWWLTRKSSGLINNSNGNTPISTNNNNNIVDDYGQTKLNSRTENKKSVARVAFMITADMRNKLSSNLGYTAQDIRSLTPQEAMLLLEHGVMKDGVVDGKDISFRARLNELMKNEDADSEQIISMNFEQQTDDTAECTRNNEIATTNNLQSLSPEEAHDMHAKPDVAMALLSADIATDATLETEKVVVFHARGRMLEDASTQPNNASTIESTKILNNTGPEEEKQRISPARSHDSSSSTTLDSSYPTQLIEVTPRESEGLGMKPDVAAAILTSHRRQQEQQNNPHIETRQAVGDGDDGGPLYWYEVIDRLPRKYSSATSNRTTKQYEQDGEEQVIAIFSTEKEALECARIKQSIRANRSNKGDDTAVQSEDCDERYFVRRRLK
jgi:hypothetical protein